MGGACFSDCLVKKDREIIQSNDKNGKSTINSETTIKKTSIFEKIKKSISLTPQESKRKLGESLDMEIETERVIKKEEKLEIIPEKKVELNKKSVSEPVKIDGMVVPSFEKVSKTNWFDLLLPG